MKGKILLVEDNENNRYLSKFLLTREGFTVVAAINGIEALKLVHTEKPDLILMDIQMPEMDGYETTRKLKENPATAHIPIVGISSFAMVSDREKALKAGFAGYIEKPIDPVTFARQIVSFFGPEHAK